VKAPPENVNFRDLPVPNGHWGSSSGSVSSPSSVHAYVLQLDADQPPVPQHVEPDASKVTCFPEVGLALTVKVARGLLPAPNAGGARSSIAASAGRPTFNGV
jgi:hypothetical protein